MKSVQHWQRGSERKFAPEKRNYRSRVRPHHTWTFLSFRHSVQWPILTQVSLSSMAAIAIEHVSTDIDRIVGKVPSTDPSVTLPHTSPLDATLPLDEDTTTPSKKKKKKKSKKSTKSKGESNVKPFTEDDEPGPLVLRISRNKHWRYISSYHVCLPHLASLSSYIAKE